MEVKTSDLKKAAENASTVDQASADSEKQQKIDDLLKELSGDPEDFSAFPELLALTNTPEYNRLKLCEELTELTEVLLKYNNKVQAYKPEESKIVEEIGDVILRTFVLMFQMNVEEEVAVRIEGKCRKLFKHYVDGKYRGGL